MNVVEKIESQYKIGSVERGQAFWAQSFKRNVIKFDGVTVWEFTFVDGSTKVVRTYVADVLMALESLINTFNQVG